MAESSAHEAAGLGEPAIVVGNADLKAQIEAHDTDAAAVAQILVSADPSGCRHASDCDGASAYFYDATEQNVTGTLHAGGGSIPTFGSGTLGYVNHIAESQRGLPRRERLSARRKSTPPRATRKRTSLR